MVEKRNRGLIQGFVELRNLAPLGGRRRSVADYVRRSVFIGTFIVYLIANIVLAISTNYAELMVFRAVQAAGSASTISIGKRKNDPSLLGV